MTGTPVAAVPMRKGPAVADRVNIRSEQGHERDVPQSAVRFFTSQGYVVLDAAGRVNPKATSTPAKKEN